MSFDTLWAELTDIGRASSGGYRRFAWTRTIKLREWFAAPRPRAGPGPGPGRQPVGVVGGPRPGRPAS